MKNQLNNLGSFVNLEAVMSVSVAILTAGMTYGSLNARVSELEKRPDPQPQIAQLQTSLNDVKDDVKDIKSDLKALLKAVISRH